MSTSTLRHYLINTVLLPSSRHSLGHESAPRTVKAGPTCASTHGERDELALVQSKHVSNPLADREPGPSHQNWDSGAEEGLDGRGADAPVRDRARQLVRRARARRQVHLDQDIMHAADVMGYESVAKSRSRVTVSQDVARSPTQPRSSQACDRPRMLHCTLSEEATVCLPLGLTGAAS